MFNFSALDLFLFWKLNELLTDITGKIGEKIQVSRFAIENVESGILVDYVHHGSKLAVIVKAEGKVTAEAKLAPARKDIAMQAAAMKPL